MVFSSIEYESVRIKHDDYTFYKVLVLIQLYMTEFKKDLEISFLKSLIALKRDGGA